MEPKQKNLVIDLATMMRACEASSRGHGKAYVAMERHFKLRGILPPNCTKMASFYHDIAGTIREQLDDETYRRGINKDER